ncbi:hypothetical protein AMECASPLE_006434 [Ameca splendens]|uniref:Uncharacterized protein n=1 Tax=Ameca splendens TaxID=208324 RepID=A0ABV0XZF1_9TELE
MCSLCSVFSEGILERTIYTWCWNLSSKGGKKRLERLPTVVFSLESRRNLQNPNFTHLASCVCVCVCVGL